MTELYQGRSDPVKAFTPPHFTVRNLHTSIHIPTFGCGQTFTLHRDCM